MEFYRVEYMLKNFEQALDEEDKHYKKQEKEYQAQQNQQSQSMKPGNTNYGGFKTPKIDVPKFNMPKFNV